MIVRHNFNNSTFNPSIHLINIVVFSDRFLGAVDIRLNIHISNFPPPLAS